MLFPLDPNTPFCNVFEVLNKELLNFFDKSINASRFSHYLFTSFNDAGTKKKSACWTNPSTRKKFKDVWDLLPNDNVSRQDIYDQILGSQDIHSFFIDTSRVLPSFNEALFDTLKNLTTHLYIHTKNLADIKKQAGESIEDHYQSFIRFNSKLCWICGTAALSQNRADIEQDEQWRADYDHILCKDKYPTYTVHPGNFIPTCHICNSKAKGAKNLLVFPRTQLRRKAFYPLAPYADSCFQYIKVNVTNSLDLSEPITSVNLQSVTTNAEVKEKINIWDEVYQISARVKHELNTSFQTKLISTLRPNDFNDFIFQLQRHSTPPLDYKESEWSFWWFRVYEFLNSQDTKFLQLIWASIEWKIQNQRDLSKVFNI